MKDAERTHDVDPGLLRLACEGDDRSFALLAAAVRPRMYRWALIHTMDADAAEDVTQRALIRMQRALSGFRGGSAFGTWMFTIVRSAAADWRRGERRRVAAYDRSVAGGSTADVTSHQPDVHGSELIDVVRRQLVHLPARQREMFDLVDLQGNSAQEAAALLSLHATTARVHLMRARRSIRARLIAGYPILVEERL